MDIKNNLYLKTILAMEKKKKDFHDFSISRIGVKQSSSLLSKVAFLQEKLPNIPKTARNYLNSPFVNAATMA